MKKLTIFCILFAILAAGSFYHKTLVRIYQGYQMQKISKQRASYYVLDGNHEILDITNKLIADKSIPHLLKAPLIKGERKILVFKYISDGNDVAGYYSYLPKGIHPVIIFLRGGNNYLGILRPNNRYSFLKGYNVVGTLYRGNIYGGKDEFGGKDINDVENLIKFFPKLTSFTHTKMQPPFSALGVSRGAMEMFTALARSSFIQNKINIAISVSGNLDLNASMKRRLEMKYMFQNLFKSSKESSLAKWLAIRDPVTNVKYLPKSLKVFLFYGLADNRVDIEEQNNFKRALDENHIATKFITFPHGNHGLDNCFTDFEYELLNSIR